MSLELPAFEQILVVILNIVLISIGNLTAELIKMIYLLWTLDKM